MTSEKFIGALLQSRDAMHLRHWQTTSFAEHKALDEYYNGILDLTDSFVEKFFGRNGRVKISLPATEMEMPVDHLKKMQKMLEDEMDNYAPDLQNIIQDMLGLVNETLYLLTLV
jgi:DNA-binding ferritin-like protein